LKALIAGFITIDTIQLPVRSVTSIGGPPSYAGLVCARFGIRVSVATRVGPDFPAEQATWLGRNGVPIRDSDRSSKRGTTKFKIVAKGDSRKLTLLERCEDIADANFDEHFDGALVSPVAKEVSVGVLGAIAKNSDFTFLDPQGFVRSFNRAGEASIRRVRPEPIVGKVDAVKMDREEATALTGKRDPKAALQKLSALGLRKAIVTQADDSCYVMDGGRLFVVPVPKATVVDTTGAGDILGGATLATYMKTRDFLWSACFGIAASSLSLHMIALSKVDLPITVDEQARRLYSLANPVVSA
jgi:sugar/nucleoside kinase (ribokinase family)